MEFFAYFLVVVAPPYHMEFLDYFFSEMGGNTLVALVDLLFYFECPSFFVDLLGGAPHRFGSTSRYLVCVPIRVIFK